MAKRFVLIGQHRSGTTYTMQLINSSSLSFCDNELFNCHHIVRASGAVDAKLRSIIHREKDPYQFLENFYESDFSKSWEYIGFNYMLCQSPTLLTNFLEDDRYKIVYIYRENLLAQYASWKKALPNLEWATKSEETAKVQRMQKINFHRGEFIEHSGEYLFNHLSFLSLVNKLNLEGRFCPVEYSEIADAPAITNKIFKFLDLPPPSNIKISIKKQGNDKILSRFNNKSELVRYIDSIGKNSWLERELANFPL